MKPIVTALIAGLLLAACAPTTPQGRIQQDPRKFNALSSKHQTMVQNGQIARGMTTDAVYIAWGNPSRVYHGSKKGRPTERWDYTGSQPAYVTSIYGGYGHGPYGYGPYGRYGYYPWMGPDIVYVPYRRATVWFVDHRVDSWERVR